MSVGELKGRERAKAVEIVFWGLPLNCFLSVVAFLNNCLLCLCLCAANSNTSRNDIGERDLRLFRVTRAFPCRRYLFSLSLSLSLPVFFFLRFSFVSNDSLSKWDQSTANLTEFPAYLALVIFISTPIPVTSCMFRFSLFFGFGFSCFLWFCFLFFLVLVKLYLYVYVCILKLCFGRRFGEKFEMIINECGSTVRLRGAVFISFPIVWYPGARERGYFLRDLTVVK